MAHMHSILRIALKLLLLGGLAQAFTPVVDPLDRFPSRNWTTMGGDWSALGGMLAVKGDGGPKARLEGVQAGDFQLDLELRAEAAGTQAGVVFRGSEMAAP